MSEQEEISSHNFRRAEDIQFVVDAIQEAVELADGDYIDNPQDLVCNVLHYIVQCTELSPVDMLRMGLEHFLVEATTDEDEETPYGGSYELTLDEVQSLKAAHQALW